MAHIYGDRQSILKTIREKLKSSLKDANFTDRHLKLKRQNDTKLGTVGPAVRRVHMVMTEFISPYSDEVLRVPAVGRFESVHCARSPFCS